MINPQHVLLLHHLRTFLDQAAEAGIPAAPLKGAHLITSVYPMKEDRGGMCDVDVLVRPRDFQRAGQVLEGMGYKRRELPQRRRTEAEFYEAGYALGLQGGRRVLLELHRQLVQIRRHPVNYNALWGRATPGDLDGAPCLRLSPEDHLLHAALHLMTDRFKAPARALRDVALLITSGGADLDIVTARARRWRCERALWLLLSLLHEVSPELELTAALSRLSPPRPVRHALRTLVPNVDGLRWPALGKRSGQVVVWPLLFDGVGPLLGFTAAYARLRLADLIQP